MITNTALDLPVDGDLAALGCAYLQDKRFEYVCDSQEIQHIAESENLCDGISALLVYVQDGEYMEIWSTNYSRPYTLDAVYQKER